MPCSALQMARDRENAGSHNSCPTDGALIGLYRLDCTHDDAVCEDCAFVFQNLNHNRHGKHEKERARLLSSRALSNHFNSDQA